MIMFTFIPSPPPQFKKIYELFHIFQLIRAYKISIILCKRNLFMESSFEARINTNRQTETALCKNF